MKLETVTGAVVTCSWRVSTHVDIEVFEFKPVITFLGNPHRSAKGRGHGCSHEARCSGPKSMSRYKKTETGDYIAWDI